MTLAFSYCSGTVVLGAMLVLAACGGDYSVIVVGSFGDPIVPIGNPCVHIGKPCVPMTEEKVKHLAAQAVFATDGLTGQASDTTVVVAGAASDAASRGLLDASLKQMDRALAAGFTNRAAGINNTLTINCTQGGTATLAVKAANGTQFSTGDTASIVASNCADGTDVVNGSITVTFDKVTGTPSSTSAWNATMALSFDNFTVNEAAVSRSANGKATLVYNQTALRTAKFSLISDAVQVRSTKPAGTAERTLTGFNASGSVNGNTFTYRTGFTLSGDFPQLDQGSYSVTTATDFVQQSGSDPSQGVLRVVASDGSVLTLTTIDSSSVNVAVDSNGDGTIEQTVTTTWDELATFA